MQTRPFFECVDGWADIEQRKAKAFDATLMTCLMTNTFTAVARLQLVQQRTSGFDDETNRCLPASPKPTHRLPGEVAEQVKGQSCRAYVRANIFSPLGISVQEMDFVIANPTRHPAHATAYCCASSSLLLRKQQPTHGASGGRYVRLEGASSPSSLHELFTASIQSG